MRFNLINGDKTRDLSSSGQPNYCIGQCLNTIALTAKPAPYTYTLHYIWERQECIWPHRIHQMLRVVSPKPTTPKLKFSKYWVGLAGVLSLCWPQLVNWAKIWSHRYRYRSLQSPTLVSFLGYACSFTAVLAIGDEEHSTAWGKFANLGSSQGLDLYTKGLRKTWYHHK